MATTEDPAAAGRRRHYGTFYGMEPAPGDRPDPERRLLLVWGNCQAEALRVLLAGSASLEPVTVRVPPVFELTADDIAHLRTLAARASVLLSQPVRDGYRDLPLGTDEVRAMMRPDSTVIRWPVLRCSAFHPFQAIVRDPRDAAHDPPVVPYHDLRTLASARHGTDRWIDRPEPAAWQAIARDSIAELQRRERASCDISISDVFDEPEPGDMFTINHPGNRVLLALAHRVQRALGGPADAADPGRHLLGEVRAPVPGESSWSVRGQQIPAVDVHRAQWQWYRDNPVIVDAGYRRHERALEQLGLA